MNFNNLKSLSREQLVELAGKQGLSVHHKAKPETIIKQIMDNALVPQKPQVAEEYADPRLKSERQPVFNTQEQVEAALAPIKAQQPAFETIYAGQTVTFRCRGAEECHNLSTPLHWLVKRANLIKVGARRPIGHRPEDFTHGQSTGKSAYTNVVLAG